MPQISYREFERLPLRVHQFLAGVPLHDVWAVDLPNPRAGITLDKCLRAANERLFTPTQVVRGLLDLRLLIGRRYSPATVELVNRTVHAAALSRE